MDLNKNGSSLLMPNYKRALVVTKAAILGKQLVNVDEYWPKNASTFCCGGESLDSLINLLLRLGIKVRASLVGLGDNRKYFYQTSEQHLMTRPAWVIYPETPEEFIRQFSLIEAHTRVDQANICHTLGGTMSSAEEFLEFLVFIALRAVFLNQDVNAAIRELILSAERSIYIGFTNTDKCGYWLSAELHQEQGVCLQSFTGGYTGVSGFGAFCFQEIPNEYLRYSSYENKLGCFTR